MPKKIATLSGATGFEDIFVSLKNIVTDYGVLIGTPVITHDAIAHLVISAEAITFAGTIDGEAFSAGEILSFTASLLSTVSKTANIYITFETATLKRTVNYEMILVAADQGS